MAGNRKRSRNSRLEYLYLSEKRPVPVYGEGAFLPEYKYRRPIFCLEVVIEGARIKKFIVP